MAVIARPIGTGGLPVRMRIWSPMVERSAWNRPTIARALDRIAHTWKRPRRARPRARGDGDLRRPSPAARSGATGAIMGSVSSSGIGDAASTRASGRSIGRVHRFVRRLAAALIVVALLPGVMPGVVPAAGHGGGIGRAAGRDRVCQYVSISVVAVDIKKKTKEYT